MAPLTSARGGQTWRPNLTDLSPIKLAVLRFSSLFTSNIVEQIACVANSGGGSRSFLPAPPFLDAQRACYAGNLKADDDQTFMWSSGY